MSFFKLAGAGGVAHVRAANATIASARRSAARGRPAPARSGTSPSARLGGGALVDGADVDESNFARF